MELFQGEQKQGFVQQESYWSLFRKDRPFNQIWKQDFQKQRLATLTQCLDFQPHKKDQKMHTITAMALQMQTICLTGLQVRWFAVIIFCGFCF